VRPTRMCPISCLQWLFVQGSELMLMRRARAYNSSCLQVVLVYLYPFRRNSLFCSRKSPKITKTPYFEIQGHARSSMLIQLKSTSQVLVMISSMSMPICNCFHARQANSRKKTLLGVPVFYTLVRKPR